MPSLTSYKGLQVLTPDPTGAGGLAIQQDFKTLVDWQPKSVWAQSADPTAADSENYDFFPGSCWLRTDVTPPKLFICQSSAVGAAVWRPVLLKVVQDASPVLGGALDAGAFKITNLADPTAAQDAATKAYVDANSGAGTQGVDGNGANVAATNTVISPGRSTGNALPAGTVIQSSIAGTSGSSLQTLFPCLTIVGETIQVKTASGVAVMDLGALSPSNQTQQLRLGSASGPGRLRLEGNGGNTSQLVFAYNGGSMWTCFTGANQVFVVSNGGSGQFLELGPGMSIRASVSPSVGSKLGASATEKWGFWGATPAVQQVLPTGAAKTVDDVITFLQSIGLCRQS